MAWTQNWFGIRDVTAQVAAALTGYLQEQLPGALASLAGLGDGLRSSWESLWSGIRGAVDGAMAAMLPLLDRFRDYWSNDLGPRLSALGATVVPALTQMGEAISRTFEALAPYVRSFLESIGNLGAAVLPIAKEIAGYIVDSFGPAIGGVIDFLAETIPLVADAFDNVLKVITPILQRTLSLITTIYNGIAGFIRENSDTIIQVLKGAWDTIAGVVKIAWDLVAGLIQTGLKLLSGD